MFPTFELEKKFWTQGRRFIVGLDEVGRGPLAGPVVAAAGCIDWKNFGKKGQGPSFFGGINDSKKLTQKRREGWYSLLTKDPDIKWALGIVSEKIIDEINILEAAKLAMKKALQKLSVNPDFLILDGNFILEDISINQKSVIGGDGKVISVAAASIIAKVSRDRMMEKYHKKFPAYGFDEHKGYGTKKHLLALKTHGPCPIHRFSFGPVKKNGCKIKSSPAD